ncbi:MAG: FAD-dependent oxidoreductase, partial [Acidimicrobiales bacterium]
MFARFGARVTLIEAQPRLLPAAEPESGDLLRAMFTREGIDVRTGHPAARVSHDGRQFTVQLNGDTLTAAQLLVATGRRTRLAELGVAALGVDAAARTIPVDDRMRAADGLWAIGDITGVSAHTHMAMYQAGIAVRDILGAGGPPADYRAVPGVTFTDPE